MKNILLYFIVFLLLPVSLLSSDIKFTPKEQVWLKEHPVIKVSNEDDWAPFDFSENTEAKGYSVDIVKNLAKIIGIKVEFVNGYSWEELLEQFDKKNIDLMHVINKSKTRKLKYSFSDAYMPWSLSYFVKDDETSINSLKDFDGKKIAAGKGWATTKILKKFYKNAEIIEYKNSLEILEALSTSKVDIAIDNILAVNYAIVENIIPNIKHVGYIKLQDSDYSNFYFMSHKDSPELVSIFTKAFEHLDLQKKLNLQKKWFSSTKKTTIKFSQEEQSWIKNNPTVTFGGEMDWAPFDYVDKNGNYQGIVKDFIKLFEKKCDLKFNTKTGLTWKQLLDALKNREIDFLPAIYKLTPERAKIGFGSDPYIKVTNKLYIKDDEKNIKSIKDIKTLKVAVIKGYATVSMFKPYLDNANIIIVKTLKEAIYAVLNHKADAFLDGQLVVDYVLKENMLKGLKSISLPYLAEDNSLRMLVRNDNKILFSIIQKLIRSISDEEKNSILNNWVTVNDFSDTTIELSNNEKRYLKKKKVIKMCIDPDWMPFEKFDKNGKHIGMTADYFEIFQKDIGIPIKAIKTQTWSESIEDAKKRECDIFSLAMATESRKKYMQFTTPYLNIPLVLATKSDIPFMDNIKYIKKERIGIVKGYAFNEIIRKEYPNIEVVDVKNINDGLQKVANGELFGFIGTLASVGYAFQKNFIGELKIAGKFNKKWQLGIGVRNDEPILLKIFEKSIKNLSTQVQHNILNKYVSIKYEKTTDYTLVIKILIGGFILMLIGLYHNIKLSRINKKMHLLQKKLTEQAHRDSMTSLYNRRYFHEVAINLMEVKKRDKTDMSILMLDIDHFKLINDTYGHSVGDDVIKLLAKLLIMYTRQSDIIARFGGEEFTILLPNTDIIGAQAIASKLKEIINQAKIPIEDNTSISFTVSIGIDKVLDDDKNIEASLNRADEALYEAKESGRNKIITYHH